MLFHINLPRFLTHLRVTKATVHPSAIILECEGLTEQRPHLGKVLLIFEEIGRVVRGTEGVAIEIARGIDQDGVGHVQSCTGLASRVLASQNVVRVHRPGKSTHTHLLINRIDWMFSDCGGKEQTVKPSPLLPLNPIDKLPLLRQNFSFTHKHLLLRNALSLGDAASMTQFGVGPDGKDQDQYQLDLLHNYFNNITQLKQSRRRALFHILPQNLATVSSQSYKQEDESYKVILHSIIINNKTVDSMCKRTKSNPSPITTTSQYMGRFHEAPTYLQDNEHIIEGYRIGYDSPTKVIKTLFMVHNETGNIWSHLIGTIIVFFFIFEGIAYGMEQSHILGKAIIQPTIQPYKINQTQLHSNMMIDSKALCQMLNEGLKEGQPQYECGTFNTNTTNPSAPLVFDQNIPTWPIMIALLGGAICLACSTVFHLMHPMSEKAYKTYLGLDFAGIGINMAFSPIPAFYYAMHCEPHIAMTYIVVIVIAGTLSFATCLSDWVHKQQNFLIKASILSFSSIVCAVGLTHLIIKQFVYGNYGDGFTIIPALPFFIPTLLSYLLGFIIYCKKCPERYHPGKFDVCGHSHQLWHICVFLAVLLTYLGSLACYEIRTQWPTCPADPSP